MPLYLKMGLVVVLGGVIALVVVLKQQGSATPLKSSVAREEPAARQAPQPESLPRLVDLGAHSCVPCRRMAPILDELRREYADRFQVEFIDVWQNPDAGRRYGIRLIPTQIFLAADGRELARHEGFMSKEAILAQWSALGISLAASPARQE